MDQKTFNGLSVMGIGLIAVGLINETEGWSQRTFIISSILLVILGLTELFSK